MRDYRDAKAMAQTLRQALAHGALPVRRVVDLGAQIALGLAATAISLLTAIGLLYGQAGTLNFADLSRAWPERRTAALDATLIGACIGLTFLAHVVPAVLLNCALTATMPPLVLGQLVREWEFSELRGDSLEEVMLDHGIQVGGLVHQLYDFGPAFRDGDVFFPDGTSLPSDGIANGHRGMKASLVSRELVAESIEVLRRLPEVAELGRPLLVAVSRKDFVGALTGRAPASRDAGTLAALGIAADAGARILRVHDVAAARDYLAVRSALSNGAGRDLRLDPALRREPV